MQNNNVSGAISSLEELRKLLFKVDNSLVDCQLIMQGYQQALAEPEPAPAVEGGANEQS